jgi:DNA gyrase inhibitor GyrI
LNINIEKIPSYRIAFIRKVGPYGTGNIQTMEKLKNWSDSNKLLNNQSIIFGIAQDNPEETRPEDCRYDVCIVVSNEFCINDDLVKQGNIIGGQYAIFKISHTAEAVKKVWTEIFPELINQGYQYDKTKPILERYSSEMVNNHYCEICVPIY